MVMVFGLVDPFELHFLWTLALIILCPLVWNIVARQEFYTHFLTRAFKGNSYVACYALAAWIFLTSAYRDYVFFDALEYQPNIDFMSSMPFQLFGGLFVIIGCIFVVSSYYRLGIIGTYLGDYFGILMKERVTAFPFNVMNNPMYNGASMIFFGRSIMGQSVAGIVLSAFIFVVYRIAIIYEGSFTTQIYVKKEKDDKKQRVRAIKKAAGIKP